MTTITQKERAEWRAICIFGNPIIEHARLTKNDVIRLLDALDAAEAGLDAAYDRLQTAKREEV